MQVQSNTNHPENYAKYTDALFTMYDVLLRPVERHISGKKLIIIPDEETAYLPFDAFISSRPGEGQTSYEELEYLLNTYTIAYGYSSSMTFMKDKDKLGGHGVNAFSPDYSNSFADFGKAINPLQGTTKEINAIFKYFKGKEYSGEEATEDNFKKSLQEPAIMHLAMHAVSDSLNSRYSYLVFDPKSDIYEDGNLYDYEMCLSRIQSPLVVLSACNTGTGTLNHGEGVMSISRAFILGGVRSVLKTLWDINDDASAVIISGFYFYLSKGMDKGEALRLAKLDYLKKSPPVYTNPYYWAAYQLIGDKSPVTENRKIRFYLVTIIVLVAVGCIIYLSFRRIFFEWS